jgi:hypothetical protein
MGDMQSLQKHRRRAIRLHIKGDHSVGIENIRQAIRTSLEGLGI